MGWVSAVAGLGSAILGKKSADKAAGASMAGFNYLKGNSIVQGTQQQATAATEQINDILGLGAGVDPTQSLAYSRLIGGADLTPVAFDDFRKSTNYDWRLSEGLKGVTGSAAAKGLLNSGATAKALTAYGQNLASDEYGRFVDQQRALSNDEANAFLNYLSAMKGQQDTGLNAAYQTAAQGQAGGQAAGQYIMQGSRELSSGLGMAAGGLADWWNNRSS